MNIIVNKLFVVIVFAILLTFITAVEKRGFGMPGEFRGEGIGTSGLSNAPPKMATTLYYSMLLTNTFLSFKI